MGGQYDKHLADDYFSDLADENEDLKRQLGELREDKRNLEESLEELQEIAESLRRTVESLSYRKARESVGLVMEDYI